MILAYTLVAASGSAFGMVTVVSQVTNSRVEFDVAGATDSDADSEADVAAVPLHRLSLVDTQLTVACDVANELILDWCAAAVDDRSASTIDPENDQRKMRPSTALTSNDELKVTAMPPCALGIQLGDVVGHEVGAGLGGLDGVGVGDELEGMIGDAVGATPGTAVGAIVGAATPTPATTLGAVDGFGVGTMK